MALSDNKWFAVQVRAKCELTVGASLRNKGYEGFVPTCRERRQWSDRHKLIDKALFSGYVFCRFNPRSRMPIVTTPGVIRIVGSANDPAPIDDREIGAIQQVVSSGFKAQPHPYLRIGSKVVICSGPLDGVEGIIDGHKNRQIVVSIHGIHRSICVELDPSSIALESSSRSRCPPGRRLIAIGEHSQLKLM